MILNCTKYVAIPIVMLYASLGCKKREAASFDPSGLTESELNEPVEEIVESTKKEIAELKKTPDFYQEKLAAEPKKSSDEWRRLIDTLNAGMTLEQVESVLPSKSLSGSYLWAYSGMRLEDTRQTMIWALDSQHATAIEVDFSGDRAWDDAGNPKPRTIRYSNRITGRPWLLFHSNNLDEYGILRHSDCRIP